MRITETARGTRQRSRSRTGPVRAAAKRIEMKMISRTWVSLPIAWSAIQVRIASRSAR